MKVKELIEILKKLDGELLVGVVNDHMEQGRIIVKPYLFETKVYSETTVFRDAFDYECYTATVYREDVFSIRGIEKKPVVLIKAGHGFI